MEDNFGEKLLTTHNRNQHLNNMMLCYFVLVFWWFSFLKQGPLCYYWNTLDQIYPLYNSLVSTELQQVANYPIFSSQVLISSLLWFTFQLRVIFSTVGRRFSTWLFKKPLWFPCNSWWPGINFQSCSMLAIARAVKKSKQLFVLPENQDRNWVRFTLAFHMAQLSCFIL